jgi:hypothetical protein
MTYTSLKKNKKNEKDGKVQRFDVCPECDASGYENWHNVAHLIYSERNNESSFSDIDFELVQCRSCKLVFERDNIIHEKWD